jgi:hypothetical protein
MMMMMVAMMVSMKMNKILAMRVGMVQRKVVGDSGD